MSNSNFFTMIVPESEPKIRLDKWLHRHLPHLSRSMISRLIQDDRVSVDGKKTKAKHAPKPGERIVLSLPEKPQKPLPEPISLNILYEDEEIIVLDKSPDLCVHPSAAHPSGTLVNALLHHCFGRLSQVGNASRPGIVHRLDKDTSGCMIAAKTDSAHEDLAKQFSDRRIVKSYLAIACGSVRPFSGKIEANLARHPSRRGQIAVSENGKFALTTYQVCEDYGLASFVEIGLHTGRTHQIRVHFEHLGFPLFGDVTYGKRRTRRLAEVLEHMPIRQMLHSCRLIFTHPKSGKKMTYETIPPADFQQTQTIIKQHHNTFL